MANAPNSVFDPAATSLTPAATTRFAGWNTGSDGISYITGTNLITFMEANIDALTFANTGLKILDTNASHALTIQCGSNITDNRTLTISPGDASRTFTMTGDLTMSGAFNLTLTTTASTTVTLPTTGTLSTLAGSEAFTNKTYSGSTLNLAVSTTIITATPSIDAAAILGQQIVTWTPSASTNASGTFVTGSMRKTIVNTTNGSIVSPGHPIAGYDYLEVTAGTNTIDLAFVHESKYKKTGTATVNNISFYKPAIDSVAGTHVNWTLYDADMDLSGVTFTNGYLIRNTLQDVGLNYLGKDLHIVTAGKIIRPQNGNEVPTALNPGIVTGRYYYSAEWGSCANNASTQGLLIATPPIIIPQRTTFTKIGVRVVTGVASSVCRFGIYKMSNGVPGAKIFGSSGTNATATNNTDVEETISVTLEAGAYFLCYQSTGGVGPPTIKTFAYTDSYLEQIYGNASSQPDAATIEDWIYVANTGTLPDPFGAVTRTRVGGALPAIYLKV